MTQDEANTLVHEAIKQVLANDELLLDLDVNERSLSHKLAHYMELSPLIKSPLSVDCEYNRDFDYVKRLRFKPISTSSDDTAGTTVFPDIIVHQRNSQKNNLIVLELKKPGRDIAEDKKKLIAFKEQYKYQYAAHVILGKSSEGKFVHGIIWISDQAAASTKQITASQSSPATHP